MAGVEDDVGKKVLLVVAEDNADTRDGGNLCGIVLGKASDDGDNGFRILRYGLAYDVSTLFFCHRGHGAGVYDINIGLFVKRNNVKTCFQKLPL